MSFVFPLLLGGLALVSVPILLHLIMRQKPRRLLFPAFRFLLQRHRTNLRKLRLRHLLLLLLRVTLIALVCLALARPRADGPVVVLLFDTSPSMDYKVQVRSRTTARLEDRSRLDEARRRAKQLLGQLPDSSRVLVLDTAGTNRAWLSPAAAGERIDKLKIRPDSLPVTRQLAEAYEAFLELTREKDGPGKDLPRFLYVFSDRTRACWDAALLDGLYRRADQVLPPVERVQDLTDRIPPLVEALQGLKDAKKLTELLEQLRVYAGSVSGSDYPNAAGIALVPQVRGEVRALIRRLDDSLAGLGKQDRARLGQQLQDFLETFRGVHEVFVDVGVEKPRDLAIVNLELPRHIDRDAPRQVFSPAETVVLRATVKATGAAFDTHIDCRLVQEDRDLGKDTLIAHKPLTDLKAGSTREVTFEIDCRKLTPGLHQVEVKVPALDSLGFSDRRFVTFKVQDARQDPHQVLVVADDLQLATPWSVALENTGEFRCKLLTTALAGKMGRQDLLRFRAICLFEVARPDHNLWELLKDYVERGGSLVVIPGGDAMNNAESKKAYNEDPAARKLLPGRLIQKVTPRKPGAAWDWQPAVYQHPLLKPFQKYNSNPDVDFVDVPRLAYSYWEVEKREGADVLIRYKGDRGRPAHPALLESGSDAKQRRGKVLLFTTPLDGKGSWNNYMETLTSFFVVLPHLTLRYLAGDMEEVNLNFESGEPVLVPLPLDPRRPPYSVGGPALEDADSTLIPAENENVLQVKGAVQPGNYPVFDNEGGRIGRFSVNVPPAECDLARVPPAQIAALFGPGAILEVDDQTDFLEALGSHWKKPLDLLPWLLALLLLVLAVENLLANKFYKREPTDAPGTSGEH
jgi:hypothetical protein